MKLPRQAGWNQVSADWYRLLDLSARGCVAGWIEETLIATSTVVTYGADAEGPTVGWIGMVLVDEDHRGEGHGTAIFAHTLEMAVEWGLSEVGLDATDAGRSIYAGHGFVDVAPIERWNGSLCVRGDDLDHASVVFDPALSDVLELDRRACGVDRRSLVSQLYHEAATETVAVADPATDAYRGYAIVRPGRKHEQIGPLIAVDAETTKRLLAAVADRIDPSSVIVDVPGASHHATLRGAGLRKSRELTRMTHRRSVRTLMGDAVVGAAGLELG